MRTILLVVMLSGMYISVSAENIIAGFQRGPSTTTNQSFFFRDPYYDSTWRCTPGNCTFYNDRMDYQTQMPPSTWDNDLDPYAIEFDKDNIYFGHLRSANFSVYSRASSRIVATYKDISGKNYTHDMAVLKGRLFFSGTGGLSWGKITPNGSGMTFKTFAPIISEGGSPLVYSIRTYGDTVWAINSRTLIRVIGDSVNFWADTTSDFKSLSVLGFDHSLAVDVSGNPWTGTVRDSIGFGKYGLAGFMCKLDAKTGKWSLVPVKGFPDLRARRSIIDKNNVMWFQCVNKDGLGKIDLNASELTAQFMDSQEMGLPSGQTDLYFELNPVGRVMICGSAYTWEDTVGIKDYYKSLASPVIRNRSIPTVHDKSQFVGNFSLNGRKLSTANPIVLSSGAFLSVRVNKNGQNIITKELGFSANPYRGLNDNR